MFSKNVNIMLYVDNVQAEKNFWQSIGFSIVSESKIMDDETFDMIPNNDSHIRFTIFSKAFIQKVSPEVLHNVPSVLFETTEIAALHQRISSQTDKISPIHNEPFANFNFASPSGIYFAVKAIG